MSGVGALHIPNVPEAARHRAASRARRSTRRSGTTTIDLSGKRVAVIGTGASAIQFVPRIAPEVGRLDLFQRTPPWVMPKPDHADAGLGAALFRSCRRRQRAYRDLLYWLLEVRALGFNGHPRLLQAAEGIAKRHIGQARSRTRSCGAS